MVHLFSAILFISAHIGRKFPLDNIESRGIVSASKHYNERYTTMESTIKRGRGRPKGSLNKKTIAAAAETEPKRGRGRPKGSKNKKNLGVQPTVTSVTRQPDADDKRVIHTYRSKKCACIIRSPINMFDVYCGAHRNELTRSK